jgi:hypothetical protein
VERSPVTQWIAVSADILSGVDDMQKEESLVPDGIRRPYRSARSLVLHTVVSCARLWPRRSLFKLGSTEFDICSG